MTIDYDILSPSPKSGGITLTATWLQDQLGAQKGEKVLVVRMDNKVVLQRLDPAHIIGPDLAALLGSEVNEE